MSDLFTRQLVRTLHYGGKLCPRNSLVPLEYTVACRIFSMKGGGVYKTVHLFDGGEVGGAGGRPVTPVL